MFNDVEQHLYRSPDAAASIQIFSSSVQYLAHFDNRVLF